MSLLPGDRDMPVSFCTVLSVLAAPLALDSISGTLAGPLHPPSSAEAHCSA